MSQFLVATLAALVGYVAGIIVENWIKKLRIKKLSDDLFAIRKERDEVSAEKDRLANNLNNQIARNERLRLTLTQSAIDRALERAARKIREATYYVKSELERFAGEANPALNDQPTYFMDEIVQESDGPLREMILKPFSDFNTMVVVARENGFTANDDYRTYLGSAAQAKIILDELENQADDPDFPIPGGATAEEIRENIASGGDTGGGPREEVSKRHHCLGLGDA